MSEIGDYLREYNEETSRERLTRKCNYAVGTFIIVASLFTAYLISRSNKNEEPRRFASSQLEQDIIHLEE